MVIPRLKEKFKGPISETVKTQFKVTNVMALPRLEKIVLSAGLGNQLDGTKLNPKAKDQVLKDLALIAGQRPIMTRAKKSVANFKVRQGYETGCMVTVRGNAMWELLDRLVSLAIPRIKDFRGLNPKSFDGCGNYSFGVTEQGIFPEINMAEVEFSHGLHVTVVFRNSDDDKSMAMLKELGMPFSQGDDLAQQRR
jgi:large subunit ribosomal protein L5